MRDEEMKECFGLDERKLFDGVGEDTALELLEK